MAVNLGNKWQFTGKGRDFPVLLGPLPHGRGSVVLGFESYFVVVSGFEWCFSHHRGYPLGISS
jgi:hypothetical protein